MGFDSPVHWLIVIAVIALLFGGSRVGSVMGELGKGIKAFKQNISDDKPDETAAAKPDAPQVQKRVSDEAKPTEARTPAAAEHGDAARH